MAGQTDFVVVIDKLYKELQDPAFRREFVKDHRQALIDADIDADALDEALLSTLSELSTTELRLVVDVIGALRGGSPIDIPF